VRVLIFHGYLLRGTGSNVYTANLVRALVAGGHEVHLLCQDSGAGQLDFVDAVGSWFDGGLVVRTLREPVRCTVYRPDIGDLLPVYVADTYEGFTAKAFASCSDGELAAYVEANVAAVGDVVARVAPDVALANHAVMGPLILARALGDTVPYAVKIHGSAMEYTVRPQPERFLPALHEGLARSRAVLVGSRHVAQRLWEVADDVRDRTRLGPPGVDVQAFRPRPPDEAAANLTVLAEQLAAGTASWGGEAGATETLRSLDPSVHRIVTYLGKLIVSKGVDLLLAAWPLVAAQVPSARLCVVGFGTYREALGEIRDALARGDLHGLRKIARRGRELEGGLPGELTYLTSFLDSLDDAATRDYQRAARAAAGTIAFTGGLEHEALPLLLPACTAQVVPSTFPEAFGMVAAEAAACGMLPVCAGHSGLAEVAATLAEALDEPLRWLLTFPRGPDAVRDIAERLVAWLTLPGAQRERAAAALAAVAQQRYGWDRVADGVLAAARGDLATLERP
jgi:glycosyltransferase involved in cell wall biosynthesis